MPDEAVIQVDALSVRYPSTPGVASVLHTVSLDVRQGEVLALIGPNGAGKTTLIRAISGVIRPSSGQVRVQGCDLASLSPRQRARILAVVPQARNLPEAFTVWQAVMMGRTPHLDWLGQATADDRQRVEWALQRTACQELADRPLGELSGGEQQRALLARALAQDTPTLLLDEPTAHLDLRHQAGLLNLVRELARERGLAVLMALHDLNLVAMYADRVALLSEGRLAALGTPEQVLTPEILMAAYQVALSVVPHPEYGTPLILPDGREFQAKSSRGG
jgi:iron complex transport system ATP-binding protein